MTVAAPGPAAGTCRLPQIAPVAASDTNQKPLLTRQGPGNLILRVERGVWPITPLE